MQRSGRRHRPHPLRGRRDFYLGKYNSPRGRQEYARVLAELAAAQPVLRFPTAKPGVMANELMMAFWGHALQHYRRPDGTQTNEVKEYRLLIRPVCSAARSPSSTNRCRTHSATRVRALNPAATCSSAAAAAAVRGLSKPVACNRYVRALKRLKAHLPPLAGTTRVTAKPK